MAVTENAIRVQLPGGAIYAPALLEAAAKTGARSGLTAAQATTLTTLVRAALDVLNTVGSSPIMLEMTVQDASIAVKMIGKNAKKPTKKALKGLETKAAGHTDSYSARVTKTAFTVRFDV